MTLDQTTIAALAERLESCQLQVRDTTKITDDFPDMDWEDAYAIQAAILARKQARGLKLAGLKAGLTSFAKMKQMGVNSPVFGFMTEDYAGPHGGEVKMAELIHPKVEPEIAFVLKKPLRGPGCHIGTVLAATDFVLPGIEVIDSRYRDFKYYETLFELFAKQFEMARIDESREGAVIQVVDVAQPPEKKAKPKKGLVAMLSALATGLTLLLWIFIRNGLNNASRDLGTAAKLAALKSALTKALGQA